MDFRAIPPYRYVCLACGKTSATRYGFDYDHSPGWDSSCMLNSLLCEPTGEQPAWSQVRPEDAVEGVHFKPEEHVPENGCATACMRCGAQVPDLGPLKTPYVCDDCKGALP